MVVEASMLLSSCLCLVCVLLVIVAKELLLIRLPPARRHGLRVENIPCFIPNDRSKKRLIEDTQDWQPRTGTTQSRSFRILAQLTGTDYSKTLTPAPTSQELTSLICLHQRSHWGLDRHPATLLSSSLWPSCWCEIQAAESDLILGISQFRSLKPCLISAALGITDQTLRAIDQQGLNDSDPSSGKQLNPVLRHKEHFCHWISAVDKRYQSKSYCFMSETLKSSVWETDW